MAKERVMQTVDKPQPLAQISVNMAGKKRVQRPKKVTKSTFDNEFLQSQVAQLTKLVKEVSVERLAAIEERDMLKGQLVSALGMNAELTAQFEDYRAVAESTIMSLEEALDAQLEAQRCELEAGENTVKGDISEGLSSSHESIAHQLVSPNPKVRRDAAEALLQLGDALAEFPVDTGVNENGEDISGGEVDYKDEGFQCEDCFVVFDGAMAYVDHDCNVDYEFGSESGFDCDDCGKHFVVASSYACHECEQVPPSPDDKYDSPKKWGDRLPEAACDDCGMCFATNRELQVHSCDPGDVFYSPVREEAPDYGYYGCDACGMLYNTPEGLDVHECDPDDVYEMEPMEPNYLSPVHECSEYEELECIDCGMLFNSAVGCEEHQCDPDDVAEIMEIQNEAYDAVSPAKLSPDEDCDDSVMSSSSFDTEDAEYVDELRNSAEYVDIYVFMSATARLLRFGLVLRDQQVITPDQYGVFKQLLIETSKN